MPLLLRRVITRGDFSTLVGWGTAVLVSGLAATIPAVPELVIEVLYIATVLIVALSYYRIAHRGDQVQFTAWDRPSIAPNWLVIGLLCIVVMILVGASLQPIGLDATPLRRVYWVTICIAGIQFWQALARGVERAQHSGSAP